MKALVTGGGGFLGGALVRALVERGDDVRTLQRGRYPALEALGVEIHTGDIAETATVHAACADRDVVFHVAGKAGVWGRLHDYYRSNVTGTENMVEACRRAGVPRLVYTSSPSIVFDGRDENGIDESTPVPDRFLTHYQRTKAQAERIVLAANSASLATVALRPHLIWGPGDPHLLPRILDRARRGRLRLVGRRNRVDATCVENAVHAHLLAADRVAPGSACAGRAYFISNGEPVPMAELINRLLAAAGLPPETRTVPPVLAYAAGCVLEGIYGLLRIEEEPVMTRFVARQLSCAHWYDIGAARRDLGYEPVVNMEEGMRRLERALAGTDDH